MQLRRLGHSDLLIAPLVLGGNVFGWTANEATSFSVLDTFIEAGGNSIDTADVYMARIPGNSGGESETIIGRWMKARGNRNKVIIATKVGSSMGPGKEGLSRGYIFEAVEASLKRLQTDYIDLYQAHRDDTKTSLEETLQAFDELVHQGKVRAIGASNYSADRLSAALHTSEQKGLIRYESLQPLYNLFDRESYERDLEPLCKEQEVGVIPYYGLAAGFLTGKYRSGHDLPNSARAQNVQKRYMNERGFAILQALDKVATAYHATPAQIALAWLMARPGITAPIASATSVKQVRELVVAADIKLDDAAIVTLNQASKWRQ